MGDDNSMYGAKTMKGVGPMRNEYDMTEVETSIEDMRKVAETLWEILDDIDTASDIIKPTTIVGYKKYYEYAMRKSKERHKFLCSDGYKLAFNKECKKNIQTK